jgi:AcrR family transcriptional regulator
MNETLDPQAVAKQPTQQRAKDRFNRILEEAENLLLEVGLSGFSIPVLAERLSYTRGSVYAYFPTHYAILNELVVRYLVDLESVFYSRAEELLSMDWREAVKAVVDHAVVFHNSNPTARLLILGGAVTDDSYRTQEMTMKRLGDLGRAVFTQRGLALPKSPPDITTLVADIGTACFRRSFFDHGTITPEYRDAAVTAMLGFLTPYIEVRATEKSLTTKTTNRKPR